MSCTSTTRPCASRKSPTSSGLRAERDQIQVDAALAALTEAARTKSGNLLELSVIAARAKATVGEISAALEKVYRALRSACAVGAGSVCRRSRADGHVERGSPIG